MMKLRYTIDNFIPPPAGLIHALQHYRMLKARLKELGAQYGDLPAHEGLWESATATSKDVLARLAIEHMVHEARGVDITPQTIERLAAGGDKTSSELLKTILADEVTHVAAGVKWFSYISRTRWPTEVRLGGDSKGKESLS